MTARLNFCRSILVALGIILTCCHVSLFAASEYKNSILFISSYNPDSFSTTNNVTAFIDEYEKLGGDCQVILENMNCLSFSESSLWKGRMATILDKYKETQPSLIILLGQEAWSSYLSQDSVIFKNAPVFCGMVSSNAVHLPDHKIATQDWEPESIDALSELKKINLKAGFAYKYDIVKNIELILDFYPDTKNIAFISDNTYGGVSLQALVKKEMRKFPDLNLILLDGRKHSIYTVSNQISELPKNSVILLGTWKVDSNNAFFMKNAVYAMTGTNHDTRVFTISSTGLGYWALAGYSPKYRTIGFDMAHQAYDLLNGNDDGLKIEYIENQYKFDVNLLKKYGFKNKPLPPDSEIFNAEPTFIEEYKYEFWVAVIFFCILIAALIITLIYYFRVKGLKIHLEESAVELLNAKEEAEKSDRLKSAFLANMSHEIRTPLNSIVGFSEILAETEDIQERKQYVNIIQHNNEILLQLINDILDMSKIEANTLEFTYNTINLNEMMSDIERMAIFKIGESNVEIIFDQKIEVCQIHTDRTRLSQVIHNLIGNAIKFTTQGSIKFGYHLINEQSEIYFYVKDTGSGIPKQKLDSVFGRFVKLNTFSQGTGLGLSICQTIIKKFGGTIGVDSEEGSGSTFWFTLPSTVIMTEPKQARGGEIEDLGKEVSAPNEEGYLLDSTASRTKSHGSTSHDSQK